MKTVFLTAIAISGLLISSVSAVFPYPVRADSISPVYFPESGLTVISPMNLTYSGRVTLNVYLNSAGALGGVDSQVSLTYSIDGVYDGSVPLKSNGELHVATVAVGTVVLPKLSEGSHNLTVSLYGLNQRSWFGSLFNMSNEPKYLWYENTVYFAINFSNNTQSKPTATPTPSPSPSPTPVTTPSNSPIQKLTIEPTQSATPLESFTSPQEVVDRAIDALPLLIGIISVVIAAISISEGFAIYLGKRKK